MENIKNTNSVELVKLKEIYSGLPDTDLNYWKNFYKKDLNSTSKFLKTRAKKKLKEIEEAKQLVSIISLATKEKAETPVEDEAIPNQDITTPKPIVEPIENKIHRVTETLMVKKDLEQEILEDHSANIEQQEETIITQDIIEQLQEQELVENLTENELCDVKAEIINSVPLDFELEKVKTNTGIFLRNQIVKFVSGIKMPKTIENISRRLLKTILIGTAILVLLPKDTSEEKKYSIVDQKTIDKVYLMSPETPTAQHQYTADFSEEAKHLDILDKVDLSLYDQLSPNAKSIYLYALEKVDSSFMIIDKPLATMYVVGKDKKLIASFPVLVGKIKGEEPNRADPNSDIAGPYATTPAGKYRVGQRFIGQNDLVEYRGRAMKIYGSGGLGIHITYPGEYEERTKSLNTPSIEDNRMSWGCINISLEMWDQYIKGNISESAFLFITPDNTSLALDPNTGKLTNINTITSKNNLAQILKQREKSIWYGGISVKNQYKKHKEQLATQNLQIKINNQYKNRKSG